MGFYDAFRDLALSIDSYELIGHSLEVSSGFERLTTEIVFHGDGSSGRGEDVIYDAVDHIAVQDAPPALPLPFKGTLDEFSQLLGEAQLFPVPPVRPETSPNYRRWGFESAALDLALRQAGLSFDAALGIEPRPVRFILSLRLGDPPDIARVNDWLAVAPWLEFKLDAENSWPRELIEQLAATGKVESVDLKGLYKDTEVDNPPEARLYRDVVDLFPDAWIEDPGFTAETRPILLEAIDRITWDAPIHSLADIEALEFEPKALNIKPSRIGPLSELLRVIEHCNRRGIAMYSGGQFELGVGRTQLHVLASVFFPDSPNDASPVDYHGFDPTESAPRSPLIPPAERIGFDW
ncbi:MAG: hypothetical protein HZB14_07755 [Actinobacteria bacterium]|nr:hypothetical protein [Actinomycetota bacterium]